MVRFFIALRPFPGYGLAALVAVTGIGAVTTVWSPGELDSALGLVLFVQLFLASTGFVATARRGHFDPILCHGRNRVAALAAQWAASITPGVLGWATLVATGFFVGSSTASSAAVGARAAAFFMVSSLSWSVGFALPRSGAGVLWTAVLMWLLLRHPDLLAWAGNETTTIGSLRMAAAIVICPFLLLGSHGQIGLAPVAAASAFVCGLLLATWRVGSRLDVYLVRQS
jgi:hypothetical protein